MKTKSLQASIVYRSVLAIAGLCAAAPLSSVAANDCIAAPSGLVAWWPGNNNPLDVVGTNHGTLLNGAGYAPGLSGPAFSFTELNHSVRIPNGPVLNPTNGLTLEGWVWVSQYPANDGVAIAGKDSPYSTRQYLIALNWAGNRWSFRPHITVPGGLKYFDGSTAIQTGAWYHVAMTYDNSALRLFVNGVLDGSLPVSGIVAPTSNPMNIGGFGVSPWTLLGRVDELSLYNRALNTNELLGIVAAGNAGKCHAVTNPPPMGRCFSAAAMFSTNSNPNGPWRYGYSTTLGGSLIPYLERGSFDGLIFWRSNIWLNSPNVVFNPSTNIVTSTTVTFAPRQLAFHPGPGGEFSVIRFTSPSNAVYRLSGSFAGVDTHGTTTDVHILKNGVTFFNGLVNGFGPGTGPAFETNVSLAMGDRLEFAVGWGANSEFSYDTTGIEASLCVLTNLPPPPPPTNCVAAANGLVSWWRGENNSLDSVDGNHGIAMNGLTYAAGRVGQGFQLDGVNDYVAISNQPNLNPSGSFSIEGWIYPNTDHTGIILAKWGDSGEYANQRSYSFQIVPGRGLQLSISDAAHQVDQPFHQFIVMGVVNPGNWNHVACVYDQTAGKRTLYVNGVSVGERIDPPITVLNSITKVAIGAWTRSPSTTLDHFNGKIDELGFYSVALTAEQVQAIYNAGGSGKCPLAVPPVITVHPTNQTVTVGANVMFSVAATGTAPLAYQWRRNGMNIAGANSTTYLLQDVQATNAATYSVRVTNIAGTVFSSNAVLVVNPPPACTPAPPSLVSWWRGEDNALDSADGNHGVAQNGATYSSGRVGRAFQLDGVDDYIAISNRPNLNPSGSFSVEGWIYPNSDHSGNIISKWGDQDDYVNLRSYSFQIVPGSGLQLSIADATHQEDVPFNQFIVMGVITTSNWNHVAGVYDQATGKRVLYVNGLKVGEQTDAPITVLSSNVKVSIGAWKRSSSASTRDHFNGRIDELSFYSAALTAEQIQAIYSAGVSGKCAVINPPPPPPPPPQPTNCIPMPSGLVAWWPGNSNTLDVVGGNHGVLTGAGYASGLNQQAFEFTALDHAVTIPDAPALNPTNGLTLESWVWVSQFPDNDGVVVAGKDAPFAQRQYLIALNWAGDRWSFRPHVGVASGLEFFDGATAVQTGGWYHVAMTHDNTTLRLYVNGVLDGSRPAPGPALPTPNPVIIGGFGVAPWTLLGRVDELSLYNRALNADEIAGIYAASSLGKCPRTNGAPVASIVVSPLTQVLGITNKVVIADVCGDATVILDGSSSSDPENDPLTYEWSEGSDSLGSTAMVTNQFAIGTHVVTLTVNDGALEGTAHEIIEVVSPAQSLGIIIAYIDDTDLGRRNGRPLIATLKAAAAAFDDCRTIPAVNQLEAFQNKVRAQIAPLDADLAERLIEAAQQIIDAVLAEP